MPRKITFVLVAALVATAVTASESQAQVSSAEAKCRAFIAKGVGKSVKAAQKAIIKCHKLRNKGKRLSTDDCNVISVADDKNKVGKADGKLALKIDDQCSVSGAPLTNVLDQFPTCHSPSETADDGNATTDIDDFGEVAGCLSAMARALSESNARQVLGLPDPTDVQNLGKTAEKCHAEVAKRYTKLIDTIAKEKAKCQKASDASGGALDYVCAGQASSKIDKALGKLNDGIDKQCGTLSLEDMNLLDMCGDSPEQLKRCVGERVASLVGGGLVAMAYNLDSCPRGFDLTLRAANCSQVTNTEWDLGINGFHHDHDTNDATLASLELTCNPSCSACAAALEASNNCRCSNDPTIVCDVVNGPDPINCGGMDCQCFLGPPQPINSGGLPMCLTQQTTSVAGTVSAGTGQVDLTAALRTKIHIGITQFQPCPTCVGDVTANDGSADGTCDGGPNNGDPCDENGNSCDFGPVSHDCPPDSANNVTGLGLQIALDPLTDGPISKPALLSGAFGTSVVCGSCTGDFTIGCSSNTPCTLAGAGTCDGSSLFPNACATPFNAFCIPGGGSPDDGECTPTQNDDFCDGAPLSNGEPFIPCASNIDCTALDPECPGGSCGNCMASKARECFVDPISAIGSAGGPFQADLATVYCQPASFNAGANAALGIPGPGRLIGDFELTPRCGQCALAPATPCSIDGDCGVSGPCVSNATVWAPPIGSSCP